MVWLLTGSSCSSSPSQEGSRAEISTPTIPSPSQSSPERSYAEVLFSGPTSHDLLMDMLNPSLKEGDGSTAKTKGIFPRDLKCS